MRIGGPALHGVIPDAPMLPLKAALTPGANGDGIGTYLREMATQQVAQLLAAIETSRPAVDGDILLNTAARAVSDGNIPQALAAIADLVRLKPEQAETLPLEPSLAPIRGQVQELLRQLTSAAKGVAEDRISAAAEALRTGKPQVAPLDPPNAKTVLSIAQGLVESGRHANILLATDLAQAVINYYGPVEVATPGGVQPGAHPRLVDPGTKPADGPWAGALVFLHDGVTGVLKTLWRRSPVLLLFLIWTGISLLVGLAAEVWSGEISFEIWGVGSTGLLGFGTYRRLHAKSLSTPRGRNALQ